MKIDAKLSERNKKFIKALIEEYECSVKEMLEILLTEYIDRMRNEYIQCGYYVEEE